MKRLGFICVVMGLLSACGTNYMSNGEKRYVHSRNGVDLVVPSPLTAGNISHFYDLPAQQKDPTVNIGVPTE